MTTLDVGVLPGAHLVIRLRHGLPPGITPADLALDAPTAVRWPACVVTGARLADGARTRPPRVTGPSLVVGGAVDPWPKRQVGTFLAAEASRRAG